jgi:allantoin racemase
VLIKVINPNTTESMTATIETWARAVIGPGTRLEAVTPPMGPSAIESHYDEALSVPGLLAEIIDGEADGVDGYVIACFGDPGLDAARELARGPVAGIAQAAMHAASFLGRGFSIITTGSRAVGHAWDLADRYGMRRACRGISACDIGVLELESSPDALPRIVDECRQALRRDRSDVIVLGCAGMADLVAPIREQLGVPVVDGVSAATVFVQSLVTMGLVTGAAGEFARPVEQVYTGLLQEFGTERPPP